VTYGIPATSAVIMLAGIFYGAMYGGSTTSILLNIPGEAASVVTCLDGYQMARRGRAGAALGVAAFGSFVAGTLGLLGMMFVHGDQPVLRGEIDQPPAVGVENRRGEHDEGFGACVPCRLERAAELLRAAHAEDLQAESEGAGRRLRGAPPSGTRRAPPGTAALDTARPGRARSGQSWFRPPGGSGP